MAQIESELFPVQQIESELGAIMTVDISGTYYGTIEESDWEQDGKYWYYTVPQSKHTLKHPVVSGVDVASGDGFEKAMFAYSKTADGEIRFISSYAVKCEYRIIGDKIYG